ncbi:transcription termination factor Rho [Gemmatirosa kalamazoonensis]|uniref:Transcription termination factor Rho n=1 Tax=Gemmatirosa kalamazoonensis TaxID=861299 RepID=W0RHH5_9BACT|nr:transcription termination factor Rho [Gemmatirosa kalamazoonensis]AHG89877.1 transcription termination factor Rho [Gemmatirosa kalamazoonensis]
MFSETVSFGGDPDVDLGSPTDLAGAAQNGATRRPGRGRRGRGQRRDEAPRAESAASDASDAPTGEATFPVAPAEPRGEPPAVREGRAEQVPETREPRESREPREPREPREGRQPGRDGRDGRDGRNGRDFRNEPRNGPRFDRQGDRQSDRQGGQQGGFDRGGRPDRHSRRRNRQRNRQRDQQPFDRQPVVTAADTAFAGWLGVGRDGGFVRQAVNSYLPGPSDPFVPQAVMKQWGLRPGDKVEVMAGRDQRGRMCVVEVTKVNDEEPQAAVKRPDFQALMATYPDRKLTLETRKMKGGPEITRRVIDLIAPIGYGQRALIVAPARSGKTMLLQAIMEGVALNHPQAALLVLLVDERPEEVSDMVACGYGEVVASSFDMPAERHREVVEMVMERSRRLVELGKDVVIVLDSITRMARAFNTIERGIGRTLSGGLDATAMAKPKAFFGSARAVAPSHGGGSLTIIGTALVETGSRMDDVIFEEFKGTGNCEIKLDRSLSERRIYPAIDIPASGTRREDKLFRPDQLDAVYVLRRGLQQMPPAAAMEWLIKRIGVTTSNDGLLSGLRDA